MAFGSLNPVSPDPYALHVCIQGLERAKLPMYWLFGKSKKKDYKWGK